jgi:DNA-binding MarR family transcriptional regulator
MKQFDGMEPAETQGETVSADALPRPIQAGQALFRLGRMFSRHSMREQLTRSTGKAPDLSQILVTEAVALARAEQPEQEVTVGVVAERLAIDPSTASRLVAETIAAGYLTRMPSQTDSRRICLEPTRAGEILVEQAHFYQQSVFEQITHQWPEQERQQFARLLVKFVASLAETDFS